MERMSYPAAETPKPASSSSLGSLDKTAMPGDGARQISEDRPSDVSLGKRPSSLMTSAPPRASVIDLTDDSSDVGLANMSDLGLPGGLSASAASQDAKASFSQSAQSVGHAQTIKPLRTDYSFLRQEEEDDGDENDDDKDGKRRAGEQDEPRGKELNAAGQQVKRSESNMTE
jgi:hypothetical protein